VAVLIETFMLADVRILQCAYCDGPPRIT
jgi:hypothetical protein